MTEYMFRRLLALVPVLLIASAIIFFTMRLFTPIDFVEQVLAESPGAGDPEIRARLRAEFGLDKQLHEQYASWLWGAARVDLGTSWSSGRPVMQGIADALPVSLEIALITTILAMFISVPLGVISAVKRNTWVDYTARFVGILGLSIPNFVLATVMLLVPAMTWGYAPPLGYASAFEDLGKHALQIVLPVISLGAVLAATQVRLLRSNMLEVLRNDYVRTARAKGLQERLVIYRHALKNALIPVVTIMGTQLSFTLGGTVVVEQIFSLPGLGRLTFTAIQRGDLPQIQASVLYLLVIFLVVNLIVDLSYAWLDPRIRYS